MVGAGQDPAIMHLAVWRPVEAEFPPKTLLGTGPGSLGAGAAVGAFAPEAASRLSL